MTQYEPGCYTCERMARIDAAAWDRIMRTRYWTLVHAYNSKLPGWLVLVANRHLTAIADLTEEEAAELGMLQRAVSLALQQVTGCVKTYVALFAEDPLHPHVHFHIVPRQVDLPEEWRGPRIFGALGAPEDQRVPESAMNDIAMKLRATEVLQMFSVRGATE